MNTQQAVEKLFNQLGELSQALASLVDTLQQEQTALVQNEFTDLESLARDKETLSARIDQLELQRRSLCQQLHIEADFDGIKHYIASISNKLLARFERNWDNISDLGSQCASQNQLNGILVANQHRHAQQALAILRGINGNDETYSATGSQQKVDIQHSLGKV